MNTSTNKTSLFSFRTAPSVPGRITDALGGEFSKNELQALGRLGTLVQVAGGRELIVEGRVGMRHSSWGLAQPRSTAMAKRMPPSVPVQFSARLL